MGAKDALEQLEAAKAECVRLERENAALKVALGRPSVMAGIDLAAIRDREEAATFGPWLADGGAVILGPAAGDDDGMWVIGDATHTEDAEFVAHARSDVPALLEIVETFRVERDAALARLREAREVLGAAILQDGQDGGTPHPALIEADEILGGDQ